jgi:nicotinate-nucleotide adenylyltransferase
METHFRNLDFIFGGSFDPPHLGHVDVVQELFETDAPRSVTLLPSGLSPLKNKWTVTPGFHRLEMLKLAFETLQSQYPIEISAHEIMKVELGHQEHTPTFQTLKEFGAPSKKWVFVMGLDQFFNLPRWKHYPEVLRLCHWLVLVRKPYGLPEALATAQSYSSQGLLKTESVPTPDPATYRVSGTEFKLVIRTTQARKASSTMIRQGLATQDQAALKLIPQGVLEYLKTHPLYGTKVPL